MINVSNEFKQHMGVDDRKFLVYLDIVLADGTELPTLTNSDLWEGGFKLDDGVTASGQFTIGSCIMNKLTLTLNNIYDKFAAYNFDRAIVTAYIGLELSSGRIEKIRKGIFTVDEPTYNGSTITLECLDNMHKLDRNYSDVKTTYPATLGTIVRDICSVCGVTLLTSTFQNYQYRIQTRPADDALTCRNVLAYAAQMACCFARCDTYGRIELRWFAQGIFEDGVVLDGGIFDSDRPYSSGDDADGGTFAPWNMGYIADAGTFEDQNKFHHLYYYSSLNVSTDDVVITGVQVTDEFEETGKEKKHTYLYGSKGYVLSIAENKFVEKGKAQSVATYLGQKLVGLRFRPMAGQFLGDPTVEAGDLAYVTDRKQRTYNCMVTNLTFTVGNYMTVTCDAETPSKNSASRYSELTQAIVEARKNTQAQISEYDLAVQQLTSLVTQSFGVYKTEEVQTDGSIIYYMHNKPTIAQSTTIWKMTADAFAVSTDGGKTWKAGMDSSGNAVVNVLSAIGIRFDWAEGGDLTLGGYNNQSGVLKILNAAGVQIGKWDKNGLVATEGIFSGALSGATGTFAGSLKVGKNFLVTNIGAMYAYSPRFVSGLRLAKNFSFNIDDADYKIFASYTYDHMYLGDPSDGANGYIWSTHLLPSGISCFGDISAIGDIGCTGTKSRIAKTENYDERKLYCYEMPSPMFGDIGSGITDSNGQCYVFFDCIFEETINTECNYQVFLQKECSGDIWVEQKEKTFFMVNGTPDLKFSWEIKAKQLNYEMERLDRSNLSQKENDIDYGEKARRMVDDYHKRMENIVYEEINKLHAL